MQYRIIVESDVDFTFMFDCKLRTSALKMFFHAVDNQYQYRQITFATLEDTVARDVICKLEFVPENR